VRRFRSLAREGGFSLVESIVAVSLVGAIVAVTGPLMTTSLRSANEVRDQSDSIDEARIAVGRIDKELRSACQVLQPAVAGTSSTLEFRTRNTAGTVDQIAYSVSGGRLYRTLNGGAPSEVSQGLVVTNQEFAHTLNNAGTLGRVAVTLEVSYDGGPARTVATTIAGRNTWSACA
jgi:type II secretory pathway pseudopilin PulG